jgi:hypothetical protein
MNARGKTVVHRISRERGRSAHSALKPASSTQSASSIRVRKASEEDKRRFIAEVSDSVGRALTHEEEEFLALLFETDPSLWEEI